MKTRVYLRMAKLPNGKTKVDAGLKPNYFAIDNGSKYGKKVYPTVHFAVDIDISDKEFDASKILLEVCIKDTIPCAEIKQVKNE